MLEIWVAEASINSVKWPTNLNFSSKFELKKIELKIKFSKKNFFLVQTYTKPNLVSKNFPFTNGGGGGVVSKKMLLTMM